MTSLNIEDLTDAKVLLLLLGKTDFDCVGSIKEVGVLVHG